jgi:hypothetical protein
LNCASDKPPLLLSREEKTVIVLLAVAIFVGATAFSLSLGFLYRALPRSGEPIDTGRLILALALFSAVFFGIVYAMVGRWPGRVTAEASMDVRQSPYDVWEAIALRDDYPGWKKIYAGIERLDEPGEVYRLRYREDSECTTCNLPRDPERSRWSSRVEIREARRPQVYRKAVFPKGLSAGTDMDELLEAEEATTELQPLAGGGARVTVRTTVLRPKMWLGFLTFLGRPAREELRSLKAHLDGTPDETLYGIAARRMDMARSAKQNCSCAER